ncbi:MAG: phosphoribosylformylglycinamidine cyclo-ligase [candidate division WOR-3 bacterium]|jgi:phosphoribosylformylglycinamidine cyclo-ligase
MLYKEAGVDIRKADEGLSEIKDLIKKTLTSNVLNLPGHFGATYKIPEGYDKPVLVSSIDSVGTKVLVAVEHGYYEGLGHDIVNHCVDDILVMGAKPLYILDYFASGKLDNKILTDIVKGMADACEENECSLIGGETAEMPDLYEDNIFDLAVQITGIVEQNKIIDGSKIEEGNRVFGLTSSGFHTNGYSLIRAVVKESGLSLGDHIDELDGVLGDLLLVPHKSYLKEVYPFLSKIKGISHITGGGFYGNISRILPKGLSCKIDPESFKVPELFRFIQKKGKIPEKEMFSVFNMGIGMVLVCEEDIDLGIEIGKIVKGDIPVVIDGI